MTVKTEFSADELIHILANYNLGQYIDFIPLIGGNVQTNLKIQTTKGWFVFRYYENRPKKSVLFEIDLLKYLKDNHYPCPTPFRDNQGNFVSMHNLKPYAIFEFMEGQHIKEPSAKQKNQLIHKVAELHNISKDYISIHKEDRLNYSIDLCRELARQASERINTKNSKEKLIWLENELDQLILPKALPMGICHSDFHFSNVLFKNDQFNALLDFDDANYTYLLFDLVVLIENWAWRHDRDKQLNMNEARKILLEYTKYRPLSEIEREHLFDVYKLSVLIDCVWFFDRGNAIDFYERRKIEYLNELGRSMFNQELFGNALIP